jgi:hypothetical protein
MLLNEAFQSVITLAFPLSGVKEIVLLLQFVLPLVLSSILLGEGLEGTATVLSTLERLDGSSVGCSSSSFLKLVVYARIVVLKQCMVVAGTSYELCLRCPLASAGAAAGTSTSSRITYAKGIIRTPIT